MWPVKQRTVGFVFTAALIAVAGVAAAEGPAPGPSSPPQATVCDFGAVGDGRADDTQALQRAVDARTGDVRLPRGVYRITRPVVIDLDRVGPTSVVGSGTARIVMAGPGPALKFIGTHEGTASPATVKPNVWERQRMPIVDGIEIVGAHEEAVGIEAAGTMEMTVTRVNVRAALHAIHLRVRNRNVIISDCLISNDREDAGDFTPLKVVGGSGNMIVDNLLGGNSDGDPVRTADR